MKKELKITFTIHDDDTATITPEVTNLDVVEVASGTIAIIQSLQQEIYRRCKRGSRNVDLYNSLIKRFVNDDNAPLFVEERKKQHLCLRCGKPLLEEDPRALCMDCINKMNECAKKARESHIWREKNMLIFKNWNCDSSVRSDRNGASKEMR